MAQCYGATYEHGFQTPCDYWSAGTMSLTTGFEDTPTPHGWSFMGRISGSPYPRAHVLGSCANHENPHNMGVNKGGRCQFCGKFIGVASGFPKDKIVTRHKHRYCSEGCAAHRRNTATTEKRENTLQFSRRESDTLFEIHWTVRHTLRRGNYEH
jgi:hypothetical protein